MATLIVFIIIALAMIYPLYKYSKGYLKHKTNLNLSRLIAVASLFISHFLAAGFIALYYITSVEKYLYYSDILSRIFVFIGFVFLVDMTISKYSPKSHFRNILKWFLLLTVIIISGYGLTLNYQPFVDASGFFHWEVPATYLRATDLGLFILSITIGAIHLFIYDKSKYKDNSSFDFGIGFLFISLGMINQDFEFTKILLYSIYLLIILGVGFIIRGVMQEKV